MHRTTECDGARNFVYKMLHQDMSNYQPLHPYGSHAVEGLRYKPEGRGFDCRWCHWNFSLALTFRPLCGPGVESASNRNEYQEYFLGGQRQPVRRADNLTTLICRLS